MAGGWVTVKRFDHPIQGELAVSRLQAEGIPARLANANFASAYPAVLEGAVWVQVLEEDEALSRRVLERDDSDVFDEEEGEGGDAPGSR